MWIDLDGLVNLRDLGGTPTLDGGVIRPGRLFRSDNLQALTPRDIDRLLGLGLTDVVDLRSPYEVASEGPGPMNSQSGVRIHHHSLFKEWQPPDAGLAIEEDLPDGALPADSAAGSTADEDLPWLELLPTVQVDHPVASYYLSYLADRPDSILGALRNIAEAQGATLVHCAAGKDRTSTVVALALSMAGVEPAAIVDDYVASNERMEAILVRLLASDTYYQNLRDRPLTSHMSHPEAMQAFLEHVDAEYGGVAPLLAGIGWTDADTNRLLAKLRG